ncbi:MAG: signal peptidase I [Dokdonella sp.]
MRPTTSAGNDSRWAVRHIARELMPMLAILVLLTAARSSLANHYVVPSGSMEYTLIPGDRVFVDMSAYGVRVPFTEVVLAERGQPARGDVVVFDSPVDGIRLIKRVAAVAGDRVDLHRGQLTINGAPLAHASEPTIESFPSRRVQLNLEHGGGPDIDNLVVPEGKVLVLGDHRGNSVDGRIYGLVPTNAFYGKAVAVYWRSGDGPVWKSL